MNITKLHYKTATLRLKNLLRHEDFDKVRINSEAAHSYWAEFPTGEIIQIWTGPSHLVNVIYHFNNERGELNPSKHEIARKVVYGIYNAINSRREINMFEKTFWKTMDGWARYFRRGYAKYMGNGVDILNA